MGLDASFIRLHEAGEEECEREEVAYFRKVNFLHEWVQKHLNNGESHNCEDIPMDLEQVAGLAQTCEQVLAAPELGPNLLPTQSGFFFGGTEYDEMYLTDVRDVRAACLRILNDEATSGRPGSGRYVYWSWW